MEYLEDTGLSYNPDMVILVFNIGDTEDSNFMKTSSINKYFIVRYIKDKLRPLYSYEILARNFYNFLYRIEGYYVDKDKTEEITDAFERLKLDAEKNVRDDWVGWIKTKNAVKKLVEICNDKDIKLVFMVSPPYYFDIPSPYESTFDKIYKEFQNLGVEHIVNPLKRLEKVDNLEDLKIKPWDGHLSLLGHQIFADELFEALIREKIINSK